MSKLPVIDPGEPPRSMRECPKWNICSVPICPLDPQWQLRSLLDNEPVCPWMTEAVKPNAAANFESEGVADLLPWCLQFNPQASARHGRIRRILAGAATSGSRIEASQAAGARLNSLRVGSQREDEE